MAEVTNLVVYSSVLFGVGHNIRRWADGVERTFTRHAINAAPLNKRSNKSRSALAKDGPRGTLKASIHGSVDRIGPAHLETIISADASYATFVLEGTSGAVAANTENWRSWMYVPSNPGFGTRTRHQFVRGQRANNFFATAASLTAATHPSLRGMDDVLFQSF